ncbi:MAG: AraC family transcriptional regulator [Rhodospirillales bacterium]
MTYLENHQVLASKDLHEMRDILTRLTNTDEIDVIGKGHEIDASLRCADLGGLSIMHVTYGDVPTRVHAYEHDEDTLLLFILTGGAAGVRHHGDDFEISTHTGLMRDKRLPLTARQEAFESFVIPLPLEDLKRHARKLVGDKAGLMDIRFDAKIDLSTPGGQHLRNTVAYIAEALDGPLYGTGNPILLEGLKELLLTSVLSLLPNSVSGLLHDRPKAVAVPYYVKRARDYIHAHADTAITLETLAHHAGCSYRTLQTAFNDAFGMSPIAYVKFVRLTLAHDDLRQAADGVSVRDVAMRWGFAHMGWFSKCYVEQFGVLPSQTLRSRA